MKRIHTLNYESYAIDYLDGNLSDADQRAFETFLERHPGIAEEFSDLDTMTVTAPAAHYPQRKKLYRGNSKSYYWAIAAGWALIIGLSAAFWFTQPTTNSTLPLVQDRVAEAEPKVEIAKVSTSKKKPQTNYKTPKLAPARIAALEIRDSREIPTPQLSSPSPEKKQVEVARASDPVSTLSRTEQDLALLKSQKYDKGDNIQPNYLDKLEKSNSGESILKPEKIAVLESLAQLLTEEQKSWVSQWRPIESLKEEIDRDRWAEALTPEFLHSSKSTK
ncbi:MAG: hypothetical protein GVX96_04845 [Bacteroidetes bacterium]|jgi:hypothetical protein|nr:hypothetical protein [Bacteroidota bacterium]